MCMKCSEAWWKHWALQLVFTKLSHAGPPWHRIHVEVTSLGPVEHLDFKYVASVHQTLLWSVAMRTFASARRLESIAHPTAHATGTRMERYWRLSNVQTSDERPKMNWTLSCVSFIIICRSYMVHYTRYFTDWYWSDQLASKACTPLNLTYATYAAGC